MRRGLLPWLFTTPNDDPGPTVGSTPMPVCASPENESAKTGWLNTLVTTYSNRRLTRSTRRMSLTNLMSTFQYIRPRNTPMPPVLLSRPRIAGRRVLNTASGLEKMLNCPAPAGWSEAELPEAATVRIQFSVSKKLALSPAPKPWPDDWEP